LALAAAAIALAGCSNGGSTAAASSGMNMKQALTNKTAPPASFIAQSEKLGAPPAHPAAPATP
jgi:hypothetical protein